MNEQDACKKFYECADSNDLEGCLAALKDISVERLNRRDDDDYDMLIQAVVAGNECAVEALLLDNRCDRTHEENLCGYTAEMFAMDYPADSRIYQAFMEAPMQEFIWRDGEIIRREDIFDRLMDGTLEADQGCIDMLYSDVARVQLLLEGKISKTDFENWAHPEELLWEGLLALLAGDGEYGSQFANWDYINDAAEADALLEFLQFCPQFADKVDWERLIKDGRQRSWKALADARPEFQEKFQEREAYRKKIMAKYTYTTFFPPFNLAEACKHNDIEVVKFHLNCISSPEQLNKVYIYPMPPGFPAALPLAAAVKADAMECIELLLEHGADPDAKSCRYDDYKTPRELAAGKPAILKLFGDVRNGD